MTISCTGSIGLDTTRTPFKTMEKSLGGSGVFFAWSASFFHKTALVGVIGSDFPPSHKKALKEKGIELALEEKKGNSFFIDWTYGSALTERKTNSIDLGVLEGYEPKVPDSLKQSQFVYAGTTLPLQQKQFVTQFPDRRFSAIDSIDFYMQKNYLPSLLDALKSFHCLFLNESEASTLAKTNSLEKAGKIIQQKGPETVVIKKGGEGAILFHKGTIKEFPAYAVKEVVDPSGAGDCFAGGFVGSLAKDGAVNEETLGKAMAYGAVMGAFCVEDFGLERLKKLNYKDIEKRYRAYNNILKQG